MNPSLAPHDNSAPISLGLSSFIRSSDPELISQPVTFVSDLSGLSFKQKEFLAYVKESKRVIYDWGHELVSVTERPFAIDPRKKQFSPQGSEKWRSLEHEEVLPLLNNAHCLSKSDVIFELLQTGTDLLVVHYSQNDPARIDSYASKIREEVLIKLNGQRSPGRLEFLTPEILKLGVLFGG